MGFLEIKGIEVYGCRIAVECDGVSDEIKRDRAKKIEDFFVFMSNENAIKFRNEWVRGT